jgi:hypothetical protein
MFSDQRKDKRRDTVSVIEYVVDGVGASETFEGIIANISNSGFCLLTTDPLDSGAKIAIKNQKYLNSQWAAVRWSARNNNLYYKVGLEFV